MGASIGEDSSDLDAESFILLDLTLSGRLKEAMLSSGLQYWTCHLKLGKSFPSMGLIEFESKDLI